jgi:hypothetical protein
VVGRLALQAREKREKRERKVKNRLVGCILKSGDIIRSSAKSSNVEVSWRMIVAFRFPFRQVVALKCLWEVDVKSKFLAHFDIKKTRTLKSTSLQIHY